MSRYLIALMMAVLGVSSLTAGDTDAERATLRALGAVQVSVSDPGPELAKGGYTREMLRTDVELKLRQSGIPIVTAKDAPVVYVSVTAVKGGLFSTYAYNAEVSVIQAVKLARDPNIISSAPTWSLSQVGQTKRARDVRDEIGPLIDRFVSLYLAMNPK